jgi:hypothetical protein
MDQKIEGRKLDQKIELLLGSCLDHLIEAPPSELVARFLPRSFDRASVRGSSRR